MAKAKQITHKPYEGPTEDLIHFGARILDEAWVVKYLGKTITIGNCVKDTLHISAGYAKRALREHIEGNYCQGHYWHKDKNNTFAKEGGWMRNSGSVAISRREFKVFAEQTTEWLLDQKIFTIEKANI